MNSLGQAVSCWLTFISDQTEMLQVCWRLGPGDRMSPHVPAPQLPTDVAGNTAPSGEQAGNEHGCADGLSTEVLSDG